MNKTSDGGSRNKTYLPPIAFIFTLYVNSNLLSRFSKYLSTIHSDIHECLFSSFTGTTETDIVCFMIAYCLASLCHLFFRQENPQENEAKNRCLILSFCIAKVLDPVSLFNDSLTKSSWRVRSDTSER